MGVLITRCLALFGFGAVQGVFSDLQIIHLNSSPDNIQLEPETGHLWIGCSPVIWKLFAHEDNCETPAPSQVWILLQYPRTLYPTSHRLPPEPCFNMEVTFPEMEIPITKIRRSWDRLISYIHNEELYTGKTASWYWHTPGYLHFVIQFNSWWLYQHLYSTFKYWFCQL